MSKSVQTDDLIDSTSNKHPRLDLQEHIQRGVILATQVCYAAGKNHLDLKEWTANQATANELLRTFENMQEKTVYTSEAIESLIAAQIKAEVKMRMDKLQERLCNEKLHPGLYSEILNYLRPSQSSSRECIVKNAIEKMKGVSSTDLGARVTEAAEAALLEEFHKGIDKQMRGYMK